jgi:hypothetical protein
MLSLLVLSTMPRRDMSKKSPGGQTVHYSRLQQLRQVLERVNAPNFGIDELCEIGLKP